MYRGRYQLGSIVPLSVWCRTSADTPTAPSNCPSMQVFNDSGTRVASLLIPIHDRYAVTGFFLYPLSLDHRFATGRYRVVYHYTVSGATKMEEDEFEVVAGGSVDGQAMNMYYLSLPQSNYVLLQTDTGRVLKLRNPKLQ